MRSAFMANIVMCLCSISSQFQTVSLTCQSLLLNCFAALLWTFLMMANIYMLFFSFGGYLKNDFGKSGFIRLIATLVKRRSLTNEPNHNFLGLSCRAWRRFPAGGEDLKGRSQLLYFIYWAIPSVVVVRSKVLISDQKAKTHWIKIKRYLTYISPQACEICSKDFTKKMNWRLKNPHYLKLLPWIYQVRTVKESSFECIKIAASMIDLECIKNGKKVTIEIKTKNKVIGLLSFDRSTT